MTRSGFLARSRSTQFVNRSSRHIRAWNRTRIKNDSQSEVRPVLLLVTVKTAIKVSPMPKRQDLTGRDAYIMVEALTFTIEALSGLPIELRPDNNISDMKRLIEAFVKQDANLAQSQLIDRRRLKNVLTYVAR